jgi:hypothetical protein
VIAAVSELLRDRGPQGGLVFHQQQMFCAVSHLQSSAKILTQLGSRDQQMCSKPTAWYLRYLFLEATPGGTKNYFNHEGV